MNSYTSFETSVALRDAGASQDGDQFWWIDSITKTGIRCSHPFSNPKTHSRAFRADEIIEALGRRIASITQVEVWRVSVDYGDPDSETWSPDDFKISSGASLVEAVALAWLAVLKEGK